MLVKNLLCGAGLLVLLGAAAGTDAAVLLKYDLTGTSSQAASAPDTFAATTVAPGLTGVNLSRSTGITKAGLGNGFSADHWTTTALTREQAVAGDEYFEWGLTVQPDFEASLSSFNTNLRRSAVAAPSHFALYASLDGFATPVFVKEFNYLGRSSGNAVNPTPDWNTTDTPAQNNGNPINTVDLTGVSQLQNIAGGTTVTFRLYAWGDGGGADTNTVALGRIDGPAIGGDVVAVPEPATLGLLGLATVGATLRRRK